MLGGVIGEVSGAVGFEFKGGGGGDWSVEEVPKGLAVAGDKSASGGGDIGAVGLAQLGVDESDSLAPGVGSAWSSCGSGDSVVAPTSLSSSVRVLVLVISVCGRVDGLWSDSSGSGDSSSRSLWEGSNS